MPDLDEREHDAFSIQTRIRSHKKLIKNPIKGRATIAAAPPMSECRQSSVPTRSQTRESVLVAAAIGAVAASVALLRWFPASIRRPRGSCC